MNTLKQLSQEPVAWVILSLILVISPHLPRFPVWSILLISALFFWRVLCIRHPRWLPSKWLLLLITIIASTGIFFHFGTLFGKTAGSVLLSILLAVKLHESKSQRDYMLLISLSFFIIVTSFLFSQSIFTLLFMLVIVIMLVISMISINQGNSPVSINQKFRLATKLLLQSIPLMLIMFLLFPRISGPLWKLPNEQQSATTGLSDTMAPGNISDLIQSNAVAFRARFKDSIPLQHQLYWRALVLWYFDGRSWEQGKQNISPSSSVHMSGETIEYTVTLEPHQQKWLYALDVPTGVPSKINYTRNYVLEAQEKIISLYQYTVSSALSYNIQIEISPWEKSAGLKIPPLSNPETIALGQKLAQQYQQPAEIISHVLKLFNQQDFHYTLKPPLTPGFNPVDQFLFQTRRGFCEHYASSFTLLMRAAGIPARIILGYQGGTINPFNQVMTVRQSDAHAWSEVWLENRGWVRIDPTAVIAPQRVEHNLEAALEEGEIRPFHMQINSGIIKDILFYWDAVDNQWNQWVIGYDSTLQKRLLQTALSRHIELSEIILLMVISFMLVLIMIAIYIIKPWKKEKRDPVVEIYHTFCRKLSNTGVTRMSFEGPLDYSLRAIEQLPEQKSHIQLITRLYIKLRFQSVNNEKQLNQFRQRTRKFRPGFRKKI
ncbi:FIG001454: Transglutaminase-like enzymes, putative cysteine proteases [hydrothermal vent metagenome]|uniref:FIG001454: Transglutaminase-like enzymes, putative cysteine proteases n=1 Tax=hydrothermal vent metagenome TaxID=652676 RepID=A0A3B0X205_9ZZZZ